MMRWLKLNADQILVISDDLDLPLGRIRMRKEGSPGGHNGLKSIAASLGTEKFPRMRVGIGRPPQPYPQAVLDWVLGKFSQDEVAMLEPGLERADQALSILFSQGFERAMNRANAPPEG
jgi:PTH1 family peptidyl-tRNA hydrolase